MDVALGILVLFGAILAMALVGLLASLGGARAWDRVWPRLSQTRWGRVAGRNFDDLWPLAVLVVMACAYLLLRP